MRISSWHERIHAKAGRGATAPSTNASYNGS
ncbi:Uncharacterised protein [Bordetella pertussis]|nr:Uncharacterised protein [Bordetella pertussis]